MTRNLTPDQINEIEAKAREHAQREWFEPGTASSGHVKLRGLHTHIYQCSVYEASHGGEVGRRIGYERNLVEWSVCDCHPDAEVTA